MGEVEQAPWRFSPLSVVSESLAFVAANFPAVARWSVAPLAYGLGFHFFMPSTPGAQGVAPSFVPALFLLAAILLWIRTPLELRLCRKLLLNAVPGHFYGLELIEKRTWAYLWAYIRVICLSVAAGGPAVVVAAMLASTLAKTGLAESMPQTASVAPMLGAFAMLGLVYVLLAPRVVLVFPDVAVDGSGRLFQQGALWEAGRRARWRIVAAMAMVWGPVLVINGTFLVGDSLGWFKNLAWGVDFTVTLAVYLLGFATMVVSAVTGAIIYRTLRLGLQT